MANRVLEQIDQTLKLFDVRANALRAMRDAIAQDPEFVTTVQDILLSPGSNGLPAPERETPAQQVQSSHFERIMHVLLTNGNRPLSVRDIADRSKLTRMQVTNMFYNSDRKCFFEKVAVSQKRFAFRIVADAATYRDFPESCLPLLDRLVTPTVPVIALHEPEQSEAKPEKAAPPKIPIRSNGPKPMPKPKHPAVSV